MSGPELSSLHGKSLIARIDSHTTRAFLTKNKGNPMKSLALIMSLGLGSSVFAADTCPFNIPEDGAKIIQAVAQTGTCQASAALAEACAFGSSMDAQIVQGANKVCINDFANKMGKQTAATYDLFLKKCRTKYADKQGTMYISFAAFCELEVNKFFSDMYLPVED
jgi:hypothetical protein